MNKQLLIVCVVALCLCASVSAMGGKRINEFKKLRTKSHGGHGPKPTPPASMDVPTSYDWGSVDGQSYLTKSVNQHLPQYCGSCWAQGAMSAFADRIKIARGAKGRDALLSVQYILNCGNAGTCYGGDHLAAYEFIAEKSGFVPYETCQPYMACSHDSDEGFCGAPGTDWTCNAMNTCRTCSTFSQNGGFCAGIGTFPNATISTYGSVSGAANMQAEILANGPIACGIDASKILEYAGGVYTQRGLGQVDHIVSVTGWGVDSTGQAYWNVRNSWGEYWGEMGYMRVALGNNVLQLESDCAWAIPGSFTEINTPCYEDGSNCGAKN